MAVEAQWNSPEAISIHVLREEDDLSAVAVVAHVQAFLSTSSARRTTCRCLLLYQRREISIHVLREEDDLLLSSTP